MRNAGLCETKEPQLLNTSLGHWKLSMGFGALMGAAPGIATRSSRLIGTHICVEISSRLSVSAKLSVRTVGCSRATRGLSLDWLVNKDSNTPTRSESCASVAGAFKRGPRVAGNEPR